MDFTDKTMHHLYVRAKMYVTLDRIKISCENTFIGYAKMVIMVYETSHCGC